MRNEALRLPRETRVLDPVEGSRHALQDQLRAVAPARRRLRIDGDTALDPAPGPSPASAPVEDDSQVASSRPVSTVSAPDSTASVVSSCRAGAKLWIYRAFRETRGPAIVGRSRAPLACAATSALISAPTSTVSPPAWLSRARARLSARSPPRTPRPDRPASPCGKDWAGCRGRPDLTAATVRGVGTGAAPATAVVGTPAAAPGGVARSDGR